MRSLMQVPGARRPSLDLREPDGIILGGAVDPQGPHHRPRIFERTEVLLGPSGGAVKGRPEQSGGRTVNSWALKAEE